jgi:DNA-binding transcriptional LysR family regulator
MKMNLHLLRVFFEVAERRSFSRAAETLFISQSAVSKAVRELERQLDLPLIERGAVGAKGTRGVRLTQSGQALVDHARGIFALERAAIEEIRARVELKRGGLIVGASTTIAGYWLPPYLAAYVEQFPAIDLRVRVGNTQAVCQALINCEVDVALVEGVVDDARIIATHWRDDALRIIAHPRAAVLRKRYPRLDKLNEQVWLLREPGSGTRQVTQRAMQAHGIEPQRRIEFGSNEGIARAVAAGLGIAMLPVRVVRELAEMGEIKTLHALGTSSWARPLFLLQLKERPSSPPVRAFCQVLERAIEER